MAADSAQNDVNSLLLFKMSFAEPRPGLGVAPSAGAVPAAACARRHSPSRRC